MAPTPCSSSGTKRSLPFHPSTSLGQKQISFPLKCVSIFYRSVHSPFPGPSSSSSSARPGLGWRCAAGTETAPLSLHLVTSLGFGLKSSHRRTFVLWQSLSPSDLGESHQPPTPPLLCPPVSVHTFQKHKQQLPGTSANQLGPKFTIASARNILIAVHPPKKSRRNHL